MCGLAGTLSPTEPAEFDVTRMMVDSLIHRGPDDEGYYHDGPVALGFRRLSIIDIEGGHQPLSTPDGRHTIVFNGEIYNYLDLRAELSADHGVDFVTSSDTEVVLHAYVMWGERAMSRLHGMFALAVWDAAQRRLFLARDRLGKKPLYLADTGDTLIFASELKSLLQHPGCLTQVDATRVPALLAYRYIPRHETLFAGVTALPPGTFAHVTPEDRTVVPRPYWNVRFAERGHPGIVADPSAAAAQVRELLSDAVRRRMVADVPVGAFLSGGLDSSLIVALMAEHASDRIDTYAVGFDGGVSETREARLVADRFGTDHHELVVSADTLMEAIPRTLWARESPISEPSDIPLGLLAKLARERVTVVLSGEGSDELFGGYPKYVFEARFGAAARSLPRGLLAGVDRIVGDRFARGRTVIRSALARDPLERYCRWFGAFDVDERARLLPPALRDIDAHAEVRDDLAGQALESDLDAMMYLDTRHWLPANLLLRADRMTMGHSLELRCPFLEHRLVEFAAQQLDPRMKVRGFAGKWILKEMARELLPPEIVQRRKWGFIVPISAWFRGPMQEVLRTTLLSPAAGRRGLVERSAVRALVDDHVEGRSDHGKQLWLLFQLELWHLMFIDGTLLPEHELTRS